MRPAYTHQNLLLKHSKRTMNEINITAASFAVNKMLSQVSESSSSFETLPPVDALTAVARHAARSARGRDAPLTPPSRLRARGRGRWSMGERKRITPVFYELPLHHTNPGTKAEGG